MKTIARIAVAGAVTATCAGLAAAPAAAAPAAAADHRAAHHGTGTVFVSSDKLTGNTVVAYRRGADGTLDQTGVYPTGGLGGQLVGSVVDHTASQGALVLDTEHHLLYSVNAGSDTITVFAVNGDHLVRLQTVGSGGSFPVSITVHDRQLFVLNARGGGSIQGYRRVGTHLVPEPAWHRDLGLDPTQTPEFVHTPGQISFTPDGSKLIVTTKAGGQSIEVFPVSAQGPSQHPVVTPDPGNVPFAVAFDERGRLLVAEAGPSAVATFTVHRDATLSLVARAATGQAATAGSSSPTTGSSSPTPPARRCPVSTTTAVCWPGWVRPPPTPEQSMRPPRRTAGSSTSRPEPPESSTNSRSGPAARSAASAR